MQVGSPAQDVRVLPGTSATACNTIWVVLPEGCPTGAPSNCAYDRGSTFNPNQSSTWSTNGLSNGGLYSLYTLEEGLLGYSGNAYYDYENISLGWPGAGLPTLSYQLVAGIATSDFYIGSLGLSPRPMNFTNFDAPQPSMLHVLRQDDYIHSTSWAYTAGAHYREPEVFGSLTLGGYDANRFVPNDITFPFGADISRDLLVGVQAIISDTMSEPLLSAGIYAFIDSLVPHIWLPLNACEAFEQAFNLTWDNNTQLYLLTNEEHENLLSINANVTLRIGPSATEGQYIEVVMPYGALDLTVSFPIVDNSTKYFPIRRAQNESQYTLGRAFLQQAYVIADYNRSNFSVYQALFPNTSIPQDLIAITPPIATLSPQRQNSSKLDIIIALPSSLVFCIIVCLLAFLIRNCKRQHARARQAEHCRSNERNEYPRPELEAAGANQVELDGNEAANIELDSAEVAHEEVDGTNGFDPSKGIMNLPGQGNISKPSEVIDSITPKATQASLYELPTESVLMPKLN